MPAPTRRETLPPHLLNQPGALQHASTKREEGRSARQPRGTTILPNTRTIVNKKSSENPYPTKVSAYGPPPAGSLPATRRTRCRRSRTIVPHVANRQPQGGSASVNPYYGPDLALVHHLGFGFHADACAPGILALLEPIRERSGLVVEFGCGSGLLTRHLIDAGHRVI